MSPVQMIGWSTLYEYLYKPPLRMAYLMFRVELCKTKATFKAIPTEPVELDFGAIKKKFNITLDAGIVLSVNINGVDVTVHHYGDLMFINGHTIEECTAIAKQVYTYAKSTPLTQRRH